MIETELKIALDADSEARLRRNPVLARLRTAPRRNEALVSVYFDTPDHALAAAGIALRLRRVGRIWLQTVKRKGASGGHGLFANEETEVPAPGGRLVLGGDDPAGVYAAIAEAVDGAALGPVFETRVKRTVELLAAPDGGEVELAIDAGEIVAGDARMPIREAELELKAGEVGGLYDLARQLFPTGPVNFEPANKSARGYRLARGKPAPGIRPRNAGTLSYDADATLETVARDVFRDCFAQIAANMVALGATDAIEAPHQLRVGLRRLRTAFAVFGPSLGRAALAGLSETAKRLGQVVGRLRDIDVLIDEVVTGAAALGLDPAARDALGGHLEARRAAVRAEVRAELAGPEATAFVFDLGRLIEARGWLAPSDYEQTSRLAAPIGSVAAGILDKRLKAVAKRAKGLRKLDAEALHELRKELKKLRYAADVIDPIYPAKRVEPYLRALKDLQDMFGSLNDAAMAGKDLSGPDAPGRGDPDAQRAIGWVLGTLAVKVADDRPRLFERWERLEAARPFWR